MSPSAPQGGSGPEVSGGGTIAVETDGMMAAAQRLAATEQELASLAARTAVCVALASGAARRMHAQEACTLLDRARRQAATVGEGLRTATLRYGWVEHAALDGQRVVAAAIAALLGGAMREAFLFFGPVGAVAVVANALVVAEALVVARTIQRTAETGRLAPQTDPVLLRALALVLASLDDGARGALLTETPEDLLTNDPAGPFGTEQVGALLAAVLLHPAGAPLAVTRTSSSDVRSPRRLVDLLDRLPDGKEAGGQVRIERYGEGGDRRWIVYIAGTVTFARDSGDEPFDLASDVLGVAHRRSDSERAVLEVMEQAGVGRDEPVLLVGHSQGALNAVRVAEDGGYRVGGVVQVGGPTGQITLPAAVPVLSVEHDEDLVTALGGTAASGAAGLDRVLIRRSLPDAGFGHRTSAATAAFPAHDLGAYRRTLVEVEAADDARVRAFTGRIGPFLDGSDGTSTRWRARRVSAGRVGAGPVSAGRAPTAVGG